MEPRLLVPLLIFFSILTNGNALKCWCDKHCPYGTTNNTCETSDFGQCFKILEYINNEHVVSMGCLGANEAGEMQCKGDNHQDPKTLLCCNHASMCNLDLHPTLAPTVTPIPVIVIENGSEDYYDDNNLFMVILSLIVTLVAILILVGIFYWRFKRCPQMRNRDPERGGVNGFPNSEESLWDMIDKSSSGQGLPLLVQKTVASQITLSKQIGKGRYGTVMKGLWREEPVAVKIFPTHHEESFQRETEIYQTVLMRHENILCYIASDIKGTGSSIQMWLITDYLEYGSLYDYLKRNQVNKQIMQRLAVSAASGLTHLHTEIHGTQGKPAIAHRDLKSQNIMVQKNLTCAIADFGLAVKAVSEKNDVDIAPSKRVGTKRYMAPEVLDAKINIKNFDEFKMADIYSFSLVLWEIAKRTTVEGCSDLYSIPYLGMVPDSPTVEEMREVVCRKCLRPKIPENWKNDEVMNVMSKLIQECWHPSPRVRLTALRLKKNILKLQPPGNFDSIEFR